MKLEIKDIYGTEVKVGFSRSGWVRMDFEGPADAWPLNKHKKTGEEIPYCISLEHDEAVLLKNFLEVMINKAETAERDG